MKLMHPSFSSPLCWDDSPIVTLTVENPVQYREMVMDLLNQSEGLKGSFVLSEDDTPVEISRHMELITDPYRLEPSENKRIINAMQKEAAVTAANEMLAEFADIYSSIAAAMAELVFKANQDAVFDPISDSSQLIKLVNWRPDTHQLSLPEKLLLYMELCQRYLKTDFFVLFQMRACMSQEERDSFCKQAEYHSWKLLLLESSGCQSEPQEHQLILDDDLCEL